MSNIPQQESLTQKTLGNAFWALSGSLSATVLQLLSTVVLARLLSPKDFGLLAAASIVVTFSQVFSNFGVHMSIVRRPVLSIASIRVGHTLAILSGLFVALVVSAISPLASLVFREPEVSLLILVLSLNFAIRGVGVVPQGLLQRELRFRTLSLIEFAAFFGGIFLFGIGLALLDFGVWAMVIGSVMTSVIQTLLLLRIRPVRPSGINRGAGLRSFLSEGGGFTAVDVAAYVALYADVIVVGRMMGMEALGLYNRAYYCMSFPVSNFSKILQKLLLPSLATIQTDKLRISRTFLTGSELAAALFLPVCAIVLVLAPELVFILFGSQWAGVVLPLQVLSLGIYLRTFHKFCGAYSSALGLVYKQLWRQGTYAILVVVGATIGVNWGIFGVACAVVVAMSFHFILSVHLVLRATDTHWTQFLSSQLRGLVWSMFVLLTGFGVSSLLKSLQVGPVLRIVLVVVFVMIPIVACFRWKPTWVFGSLGQRLIHNIFEFFRNKQGRLRDFLSLKSGRNFKGTV